MFFIIYLFILDSQLLSYLISYNFCLTHLYNILFAIKYFKT